MARKKGNRQCVEQASAAILAALDNGDEASAIYLANAALLGALAGLRKDKPGAPSMLKHAEVAGAITAVALSLAEQPTPEPLGYTGGIPSGRDLRAVFSETLSKSLGRLTGKGAPGGN